MEFLPKLFSGRKAKVSTPLRPDPNVWFMQWTRRGVPQTGGQNYSLSSRRLPLYNLSGPYLSPARPIKPVAAAFPKTERYISTISSPVSGANLGQFYSQPLIDVRAGGYTQSLTPISNRPYDPFGILPAGAF